MTINGTDSSSLGGSHINSSDISSIVIDPNPSEGLQINSTVSGPDVSIYANGYSTTTSLLVVVHILFLYHRWTRRARKRLLVSYKTLVQRKHFHKAILAILSHPPNRLSRTPREQYLATFVPMVLRDLYNTSPLTNGKHLSGLPLLFYNSYLLWSCRALEGKFYQDSPTKPMSYARALWGLTLTGFVLDVGFTGCVLRMVRDLNYGTSNSTQSATRPEVIQQVESFLCRRTLGGLTTTTSAALALFRFHFHFVPIQLFPLLPTWLPILSIPSISYALAITILLALNHSTHPIASIIFGTLSGLLWSQDMTSFLAEPYWSNGTVFAYIFLCGLSLRATASSFVPCIDFVSWDDQGRRIQTTSTTSSDDGNEVFELQANVFVNSDQGDDDTSNHSLEDEQEHEVELPMYNDAQQDLRHRLPVMTDMEENDNDDDDDSTPLYTPNSSRQTGNTIRSRRIRP